MINIKNKIFVISGTSSGIGNYLAKELLKLKCIVVGISRKRTLINDKRFTNYCLDLNSSIQVKKLKFFLKYKFKKIDVLINNAGISKQGYNIGHFETNIKNNLFSTYQLTLNLIPLIKKNGKIINISSIASLYGFENNPGYNSAKAALNSLTKSISNDFAKNNIYCNSISLGYFKTRMTKKSYMTLKERKIRSDQTLLKRWGKKSEILGPIIFLSSAMSNYITGQNIIVDGGWSIKGFKF